MSFCSDGKPSFTLICPNSTIPKKYVWFRQDFTKKDFSKVCSDHKKSLRIAFNNQLPYFSTNSDKLSLDGYFIRSFIEAKKIDATWQDANKSWGSLDPGTGRFDGVVGMV